MSQDIAVSEIRRRILRYWWIPVLCALIGTAVGLAAPKTVPPLYRSQATVLVGSTEGSVTHSSTIRAVRTSQPSTPTWRAARSCSGRSCSA